jgi:tetratricopeptide (TPR) repeat protein
MDFNDYVSRGVAFFHENKIGQAIENFQAALKLQPDNQEIREFIGMAEAMVNAQAQAYQVAADEAKHRAESRGIEIENIDKAIAEYTETLKRSPNDASAENNLAHAYYIRGLTFTSKGERTQAIADYSEAIKYIPDFAHAICKRGGEYSETGDFDNAIADFEKLISINPDYNMAKDSLVGAYMKRGAAYDNKRDYARAIADFEKALKLNPDNNTARELLEMVKAEQAKH